MNQQSVLVVNAGSSSIKFALYARGDRPTPLYRGQADGLGGDARFRVSDLVEGGTEQRALRGGDHRAAIEALMEWVEHCSRDRPLAAAGHRVVHGGTRYSEPVRLTDGILAELEDLKGLAPLHQPHNLSPVRLLAELRPDLPQTASFDTAFHRDQPWYAQRFALPRSYADEGVLRYGFHGLSYQYMARWLKEHHPELHRGRVIVAHLGNGASLCAMRGGRSVATSMGFTALDGLPMGQRCGSLDPGVVLYLIRQRGMAAEDVEDLLYRRSGLLGMSGISHDVRALLESREPAAAEALEIYCYRAAREIGSLAAALGGMDALVFTAGVGEHAAPVRADICGRLSWLGVALDEERNRGHAGCISHDDSTPVLVVPTDEEGEIARDIETLLRGGG
ncbi:MAG: acetate/propionate family kinase [Ectothiorhodospiraceae bacterium]|nr:acetate/propionate family kinase [Ectothiorhodospiraceae bacterium]MCH8503071.1 acetate/propionate family kinase [Ectothiorhodospiraceae bacterium]